MPEGTEPIPGATPPEAAGDAGALAQTRSELADIQGDPQKIKPPESYFERQTSGNTIDPFKDIKVNPEAFSKEALDKAAEKAARYLQSKLTGIDGQPLPDTAAEAAIDSVRAERDARTQEMLLELATKPAEQETASQIQQRALDTLFLGVVANWSEEQYRAGLHAAQEKAERYMKVTEKHVNPFTGVIIDPEVLRRGFDEMTKVKFERYVKQAPDLKTPPGGQDKPA